MSLDKLLEEECYYPDGTMRQHHREFLLRKGETEETIAMFEQIQKEEIARREIIKKANGSDFIAHDDWTEWEDAIYED